MQERLSTRKYIKRYLKRCITGPWSLICGLSVSLKYFFDPRRIVTEQYPENRKTLKMHERYRGRLEMIEDAEGNNHCTACGMCVNVLSTKNIAGKKVLGRYVYHFASCTQCGLCVEACPFGAIRMSQAFEVATTDPNTLEMILNKKEGQG